MKVVEKTSCITFYSVNSNYFDKFNEVNCGSSTRTYWQTAASNAGTLIYHIHFQAKDEQSGELFIEYKGKMHCTVKIEDEKQDALQMLTFIDEFHSSMNSFIKNNSLFHSSKLNLKEYQITESGMAKMEAGMARLKDMMKHEDKTEAQKRREWEFEDMEHRVEVIKIKTVIS